MKKLKQCHFLRGIGCKSLTCSIVSSFQCFLSIWLRPPLLKRGGSEGESKWISAAPVSAQAFVHKGLRGVDGQICKIERK